MKYQSQIQFYTWSLRVFAPLVLLSLIPMSFIAYNRFTKGSYETGTVAVVAGIIIALFAAYVITVSRKRLKHYKSFTQDVSQDVKITSLEPKMPDAEDLAAADEILAATQETQPEVNFVEELRFMEKYIPDFDKLVEQAALDAGQEKLEGVIDTYTVSSTVLDNYKHHVALVRLILRHFGVEDLVPNMQVEQVERSGIRFNLITLLGEMSAGLRDYNLQIARGTTVAFLYQYNINVHNPSDDVYDRADKIEINEGLVDRIQSYGNTLPKCKIPRGKLMDSIAIEMVLEEDRVKAELASHAVEEPAKVISTVPLDLAAGFAAYRAVRDKDLLGSTLKVVDSVVQKEVDSQAVSTAIMQNVVDEPSAIRGGDASLAQIDDAGLFEFPEDPEANPFFAAPNGKIYTWKEGAWVEHMDTNTALGFPNPEDQKTFTSPEGKTYFWNDGWYEDTAIPETPSQAEERVKEVKESLDKLVDPTHGNTEKILELSAKIVNDHPETADLVAEIAKANGINVETIPVNERNRQMAERLLAGGELPPVNRADRRAHERETRRAAKKLNSKANLNRGRKNAKKK